MKINLLKNGKQKKSKIQEGENSSSSSVLPSLTFSLNPVPETSNNDSSTLTQETKISVPTTIPIEQLPTFDPLNICCSPEKITFLDFELSPQCLASVLQSFDCKSQSPTSLMENFQNGGDQLQPPSISAEEIDQLFDLFSAQNDLEELLLPFSSRPEESFFDSSSLPSLPPFPQL